MTPREQLVALTEIWRHAANESFTERESRVLRKRCRILIQTIEMNTEGHQED